MPYFHHPQKFNITLRNTAIKQKRDNHKNFKRKKRKNVEMRTEVIALGWAWILLNDNNKRKDDDGLRRRKVAWWVTAGFNLPFKISLTTRCAAWKVSRLIIFRKQATDGKFLGFVSSLWWFLIYLNVCGVNNEGC
jgi:hypothetical protein